MPMSRISPKGRFIYAFHKSIERSNAAFDNLISEGEKSLSEIDQEIIRDYRGRFQGVAITIE